MSISSAPYSMAICVSYCLTSGNVYPVGNDVDTTAVFIPVFFKVSFTSFVKLGKTQIAAGFKFGFSLLLLMALSTKA